MQRVAAGGGGCVSARLGPRPQRLRLDSACGSTRWVSSAAYKRPRVAQCADIGKAYSTRVEDGALTHLKRWAMRTWSGGGVHGPRGWVAVETPTW